MWIRPSIPSRSTKAPKSTMLEILPSTTIPGCSRPRICSRTSLRSSSSTARRERTTLLRLRLSSMTLHSRVSPLNSSRLWTRRMSTSDAGRKPRTPRSRMSPPLTTSITIPSTGSPESAGGPILAPALDDLNHDPLDRLAGFGGGLDLAPGLLEAGPLLGEEQAPLLVLLGEDERVDPLAKRDLLGRVDGPADRKLVGGDDALALVADVDEDLVLVDADHVPT